jgi:Domain of unknown function (DUF6916)
MLLKDLTKEMFSESMNTKFRLGPEPSRSIELELIALTEGVSNPGHEQFSLIFRGPLDYFLGQGTYQIEHDKMGEIGLFLVPVSQEQDGFRYEAVFNRARGN